MAKNPELFPEFWDFVGMESRPYFWGSAAIVVTDKYRVLLGKKLSNRNVYGGTLTPPAGIVDTNDFITEEVGGEYKVQSAFVSAALRELQEETGFNVSGFEVANAAIYWDIERSKGQAFVLFHANDSWLQNAINEPDANPTETEFDKFELVGRTSKPENLSTEGVAAMYIARSL